MSISASVPQRLVDSVDESPVVAYVKDLDGRYLHVNRRYEEFFAVGGDDIRGRTDEELGPRQTIDGPRLATGGVSDDEPLQLEYTVAAFDGRPALAVWRFTVRSADSDTVAVCGVAAPVADAVLARRECERVMAIAHEVNAAEAEAAEEVDESQSDDYRIAALHEASASATRRAQELLSELTAERERRTEAEIRAAHGDELRRQVEAAEDAALAERERADEADAAAQRERERADAANAAIRAERSRADEAASDLNAARGELASVRGRLERAEATVHREAARAEEAEAAAQRDRARVDEVLSELNAARGELASVRGRIEGLEAAAQRETARAEETEAAAQRERSRAEEALAELADLRQQRVGAAEAAEAERVRAAEEADAAIEAERSRAEQSQAELDATRAQLEAARAELASEREQRTHSDQEMVDDLRGQLSHALTEMEAERTRAERSSAELTAAREELAAARAEFASEVEQRTQSEREVVEKLRRELAEAETDHDAARAQLESAQAELASERERRTQTEAEVISDLRRQVEDAAAELNAMRAQLQAAPANDALDDLGHKLEYATAAAQQEKTRADAAEVALNTERADAEIRIGVAERRIAELEASLAEARAHESEAPREHGATGPRWDLAAQRAFTTALSESSDWRVSVKSAIGVIGSQGGWDAVCAWQPDDRNGFASCFAMWTGENRRLGALETATWQRRQPLSGSTIGEALSWEECQWLAPDPRAADRRLQLLAQHGMRGALIVPVKDGPRPVAALELLTVGATEPSRELVDAIQTIALQLGHFSQLLSESAQPRWRFGRT